MNWDRIEGNWKQFKGKVQQQWGSLTDDDLDKVEGKQQELAGRIQERYGKTRTRPSARSTTGSPATDRAREPGQPPGSHARQASTDAAVRKNRA